MLRIDRIGVTWSAADHLCLNHYRTREHVAHIVRNMFTRSLALGPKAVDDLFDADVWLVFELG
jgi:hypothetical protein